MTTHLIYEVNLQLDPEIEAAYLNWLQDHIKIMLKQPGFREATIYAQPQSQGTYVVLYNVATEQDLENYLQNEAPKMRADGVNLFGNKFQATRRILKAIN